MPKASIIIPVYNVEKYIDKCIDSILRQTFHNFELILVDDGSKDLSGEICKNYANRDNRVKYIYKENGGVSSARNYGLQVADGEYIVFIDSDDFIKEDMLERLIKTNEVDFAMCGYELYDDTANVVTDQYFCPRLCGNIHDLSQNISDYLYPPFLLGPCFKLFKKNIIENNQIQFPLDISYGEDAVFVLNYLLHAQSVEIIDCIGYSYRKHGNETLSGKFLCDKIDINHRINVLIDKLLNQENIATRSQIVSDRLLECFVAYTKELLSSNLSFVEKRKIFYDKYNYYKNEFGHPQRLAQRMVIMVGNCKVCYPLVYLFRNRG